LVAERTVEFLPAARLEFAEAYEWYAARSSRAAQDFVNEIDRQVVRIAKNAEAFPIAVADVRRVRLRRFPYNLYFREADGMCFVVACFHGSRDPRVWQGRA
jgi:plasmid stabilization system protein ParE